MSIYQECTEFDKFEVCCIMLVGVGNMYYMYFITGYETQPVEIRQ